jgi:RNA polymerase sigma factor (sigma-70 family)
MMGETNKPEAERQLVEALKAEDMSAWDEFLDQKDSIIRGVVSWKKWFFPVDTQNDVAQQIRTALLKSIPAFKGQSSLDHYVKTICVRTCIGEVRRQVRSRAIFVPTVIEEDDENWIEVDFAADEIDEPVRAVILAERIQAMRRVLENLEEKCRAIIRQFFMEQLSYKQMAEAQKVSIKTIGSRLSRCLDKLRDLSKKDPDLGEEIRG